MKNLIKELKRRQEKELEYQLDLIKLDNTSYRSVSEYRELASELQYCETRLDQLQEIIFFLENGVWEDELHFTKKSGSN